MKKISREAQIYIDRVWRSRNRKTALHSKFRKLRAKYAKPKTPRSLAGRIFRVNAPEVFGARIEPSRSTLVNFLRRIHELTDKGAIAKINFDETTRLATGGVILFVATIESILASKPGSVICDYPKDEVVEQLFQHLGILEKLGLNARKTITAENVRHWHFLKGTNTDLSGITSLFNVLATKLSDATSSGLFDSISEAVTNVVQHAYLGVATLAAGKPHWWLFAQVTAKNELQISICDLGKGIPASLMEKPELADLLPKLIYRMRKRVSSGMIEIAVESGRSRTKLPHRGKGLPDMLAFCKNTDVGLFYIASHKGLFFYSSANDVESARDFSDALNGTVIVWSIPLGQRNEQ